MKFFLWCLFGKKRKQCKKCRKTFYETFKFEYHGSFFEQSPCCKEEYIFV